MEAMPVSRIDFIPGIPGLVVRRIKRVRDSSPERPHLSCLMHAHPLLTDSAQNRRA